MGNRGEPDGAGCSASVSGRSYPLRLRYRLTKAVKISHKLGVNVGPNDLREVLSSAGLSCLEVGTGRWE